MSKNVVRIQMEMFTPGVLVRGGLMRLYVHPSERYVWYPEQPRFEMEEDGLALRFVDPGTMLHFDALGVETDMICTGDIDFLMTLKPVGELFAESIPPLAEMMQSRLQSLQPHSLWAALAIYEADMDAQKVTFEGFLNLDAIVDVLAT